jgi:hypothetical protein
VDHQALRQRYGQASGAITSGQMPPGLPLAGRFLDVEIASEP